MLNLKEATDFALAVIRNVYGEEAKDFRMEEVFVPDSPTESKWIITIGFSVPETNPVFQNALAAVLQGNQPKRFERVYKRVTLDEDGALKSIENRIVV